MSKENPVQPFVRVLVVSRNPAYELKNLLIQRGFTVVDGTPDFIISYGGDGTVLLSERMYPGVPKLVVKKTRICRKCDYTLPQLQRILPKIRSGEYLLHREMKLEAEFKGKKLIGLNEIQLHNKLPMYAIRFSLSLNGDELGELIGDGAIIATPFGSTGYYKATGGKPFEKGMGIAFNNLHNKPLESIVVPENSIIKIAVTRGPAWILADNSEEFMELEKMDVCVIRKAEDAASLIYIQQ